MTSKKKKNSKKNLEKVPPIPSDNKGKWDVKPASIEAMGDLVSIDNAYTKFEEKDKDTEKKE